MYFVHGFKSVEVEGGDLCVCVCVKVSLWVCGRVYMGMMVYIV